jgi:hypothetical protein
MFPASPRKARCLTSPENVRPLRDAESAGRAVAGNSRRPRKPAGPAHWACSVGRWAGPCAGGGRSRGWWAGPRPGSPARKEKLSYSGDLERSFRCPASLPVCFNQRFRRIHPQGPQSPLCQSFRLPTETCARTGQPHAGVWQERRALQNTWLSFSLTGQISMVTGVTMCLALLARWKVNAVLHKPVNFQL